MQLLSPALARAHRIPSPNIVGVVVFLGWAYILALSVMQHGSHHFHCMLAISVMTMVVYASGPRHPQIRLYYSIFEQKATAPGKVLCKMKLIWV